MSLDLQKQHTQPSNVQVSICSIHSLDYETTRTSSRLRPCIVAHSHAQDVRLCSQFHEATAQLLFVPSTYS